jgi:hypothetical protein
MSKVRDISGLANIIKTDANGNVTFVSGSTTLMAISSSGAVTSTGTIGGSNSSTLATTGSNTFTGQQYVSNTNAPVNFTDTASLYTDGGLRVGKDAYVSGTLYLNNLTVFGTQSVNFITSSQLDISDNVITVNTSTPAIRFGGIAVRDSGSLGTGLTGSLLWDSQNNHWVYTNPSGSSYSGGMMISGPRASSLGEEQGTTFNALMKGQGGDHITSSGIFESGSNVGIGISSPTTQFNVYANTAATSNAMAEFYNADYTSTTRNFIRVRNGIGVGSTYSSYFGQGADRNTYIIANDTSRNDIIINGDNGYVGIGKTSPSTILDVNGSITSRSPASTGAWYIKDTSGGNKYEIGWESTTSALYFYSYLTNTSVLRISGSNVGIGIAIPVVPLHVAGTGGVVRIGDSSNNLRIGNDGGGTYMEQYGTSTATSVFRIQSSKAANAIDYTIVTIDPYSGLNVTKSGTGGNNVFASGVPIQVVYGAAIASSGPQGTGVSLGTACNGDTPSSTQGIQIASVSFTPKKANSLILIQTNSVAMWERSNISDHFYLWAANTTDSTILVKAGQYLQNFGSGGQNGGVMCLQGIAASWGTSTKTISFRIGSTGGGENYEYNPYYNAGGFSNATVGNFTYVITEIGQ